MPDPQPPFTPPQQPKHDAPPADLPPHSVRPKGKASHRLAIGGIFLGAAGVAALAAWAAVITIEDRSADAVSKRLLQAGISWAEVKTDGLQLRISGVAPNEAARFRVINLIGTEIDSARIRDDIEVSPVKEIEYPAYSLEMLRNDDGIQLIGLLPEGDQLDALKAQADGLDRGGVSDMIETATYPAPEGWEPAFDFALKALKTLPRTKISVSAGKVVITAIAESESEQRRLTTELNRARPEGVNVRIDISAPRPVLTPFTLRFLSDEQGPRFDACSADTERARIRILAAGTSAGVTGQVTCTIGLGVPSPSWADAATMAIGAVHELGKASVTFSDADVSLEADASVEQALFDRVVGELQGDLPGVFSLKASRAKPETPGLTGPTEFTAQLNAEGRIELRGRLIDSSQRDAIDSYAKARFGATNVMTATRYDSELPQGWPVRVLAGLEAMSQLAQGRLVVRADQVEIEGVSGNQNARARISQILSDKLGQGQGFRISVRYDKELDPLAALPTAEECLDQANAVLARRKIVFAPGSAEIDGPSSGVIDDLAKALKKCGHIKLEIGGHTDSQGSEEGNRALSQARAEAVLVALQGRGIDTQNMLAHGYGEDQPIADNGTEAGRESNRRIAFTLRDQPAPAPATEAAADASAEAATDGAAPAEATEGATDPLAQDNATDTQEGDASGDPAPAEASTEDAAAAPEAEASEYSRMEPGEFAPTRAYKRPVARPDTPR